MGKVKKLLIVVATFVFVSIFPNQPDAHPGGLDKLGGHFRSSDCAYLLHKPTSLAKTAKSKAQLLTLIKKHSSNSCKNQLTVNKIYVEGGYNLPNGTAPKPAPTLKTKYPATLSSCTDGDTANFKINGKVTKTRFLFIDTPEYTTSKEKYGKEASIYTCSRLKKAKKITLELDGKDKYDKYNRLLAWVWVDGKLLQEDITKAGWVEDFYDYGTYRYESRIRSAMSYAKKYDKGMY
ncbi:thermonuclease family protein [Peribacillus glennii]|uniref:Nuclease n=1 Tax=Peribacillus glennii TaxID=2303991 RepID=A0A372LFK0_9BACI|nr:thermonuclease family protein [Peribacillus glennii]RFU65075.1 nuclease [Peribacillus glennii]